MFFSKTGHEGNGFLEIRNREFKNSKITNRKLVVCEWSRQMHCCSSVTKKKKFPAARPSEHISQIKRLSRKRKRYREREGERDLTAE